MAEDHLSTLELEAWGGLLRTHTVVWREAERRLVEKQGMTISHYDVLLRLAWARSDGLRMGELADQVLMTTGGLTRLADRLERDGLIERGRSSEDLRGFVARITPKGRRALARANHQHLRDVRELFLDHVSQAELTLLAKVWARVKAANAELLPAG